ncbi:MAG: glycoside hydrolase family 99-like domain-containing protein [Burkholderiales bacterium]
MSSPSDIAPAPNEGADSASDLSLAFTGERYVPELGGEIRYEHLHRYAVCLESVHGRIVLDLASGEGYGAALLASRADRVIGIDVATDAVRHAVARYSDRPNLTFIAARADRLPLSDACVDVVTSFETIEHLTGQAEMIGEIKRVLRPGGVLFISSPDKRVYSDIPDHHNAYHLHELHAEEFHALLSRRFGNVKMYGQRMILVSSIAGVPGGRELGSERISALAVDTKGRMVPGGLQMPDPVYLLAYCSDASLPPLPGSVFIDRTQDLYCEHRQTAQWAEQALRESAELTSRLERQLDLRTTPPGGPNTDRDDTAVPVSLVDAAPRFRLTANGGLLRERLAQGLRLEVRLKEVEAAQGRSFELLRLQEAQLAREARRARREALRAERLSRRVEHLAQRLQDAERRREAAKAKSDLAQQGLDESALRLRQADEAHQAKAWAMQCHVRELEIAHGNREGELREARAALAVQEATLASICASWSWRATKPFRDGAQQILRWRDSCVGVMTTVYRRLPVSAGSKQRLKGLFFAFTGYAMRGSASYEAWLATKRWKAVEAAAAVGVEETTTVEEALPHEGVQRALPAADGRWEWRDGESVRQRIAAIDHARRMAMRVTPAQMISLSGESPLQAARRVRLPRPPAQPEVSIVIPAFNNVDLTCECLLSIAIHAEGAPSFEVIVCDDGSTDGTAAALAQIEHLVLITGAANMGFLRNCNRALPRARGRNVLFLNNDVQVTANWLNSLAKVFVEHPDAGIAGPRIIYPSGYLQESGVGLRCDGTPQMIGLNDDPDLPEYSFTRRVDFVSGACMLVRGDLLRKLGGFSEDYLPCYAEDADLCLAARSLGYSVFCAADSVVVHHLSRTTGALPDDFKMRCVTRNLSTLYRKWQEEIDESARIRAIAFYLPQFHPIAENDAWWGQGFTEWANVVKAKPNFVGQDQPRVPADLGYYDLRAAEVMEAQAELARRYGVAGFCFYYYWFGGRRLLEAPIENMLASGRPDFPFCLCWANENWTRRWDGRADDVLIGQAHSADDDLAVIEDLSRYFRDPRYIRVVGKPLILVYRVNLFPDFCETARRWRDACRASGIGEIHVSMVESLELATRTLHPSDYGCDSSVEFPPQEMADPRPPAGQILNPRFSGQVADYRDLAVRFGARPAPGYTRFRGVAPGWDNTPRRQDNPFTFEHATPGAFRAWLNAAIEHTFVERGPGERLLFINAWNEWAEGAYLEPDRRFGHAYLQAVRDALDAADMGVAS